jgi:hypothetical protein
MVSEPDCNQPGVWTTREDGRLVDSWGRDLSSVYDEPVDDCGHPVLAPIFFMSFMILTTFVSLNIMVAVILYTFFDIEGSPGGAMLDEQRVEKFMEATQSSDVDYDQNGMIEIKMLQDFLVKVKPPLGIGETTVGHQVTTTLEEDWLDFMKGSLVTENGQRKRDVKTGLNYHMMQVAQTRRRLVINGAKDVADADGMGASDPYAIVWWNGREIGRTDTVFETLHPVWEEDYPVDLAENQGTNYLRVEIYDQDNADSDDFLGQVEVALPGGHHDDAFLNRTYRLGRQLGHTLPVKTEGKRRSLMSRFKKSEKSDSVNIGHLGIKGTLTVSLKKEIWIDGDGEAEVDREELLRFCIKRKYGVDVRPPTATEKTGLVASAGRIAGMAFTMPSMRNLNAVAPSAGAGDAMKSDKPSLGKLSAKHITVAGHKRSAEIDQLLKLTPRDHEDEGLTGDKSVAPPSPQPPAPAGASEPGPRKPKVKLEADTTDPPTRAFLDGVDCDDAERSISPDFDDKGGEEAQMALPGATDLVNLN